MFSLGERLEFSYPVYNHVEIAPVMKPRKIEIVAVRDLVMCPLTPEQFLRRPMLRRSRWMIEGVDLAIGRARKFYIGNSLEYHSPGSLRIGLYAPGEKRPRKFITKAYGPSWQARHELCRLLKMLMGQDIHDLMLGVVATDLGIIQDFAH